MYVDMHLCEYACCGVHPYICVHTHFNSSTWKLLLVVKGKLGKSETVKLCLCLEWSIAYVQDQKNFS